MTKPTLAFDHLVIASADLAAGIAYIRNTFGVEIPRGGQHHFMGTHNAVMAVGDGIYLEVVAIDPSLPAPPGPRWFGLDTTALKDRMKDDPVLVHYVLRTNNMAATLEGIDAGLLDGLGPVMAASRGDLCWQISLNSDGIPPEGGSIPSLIEWQGTPPQYGMAFPGPVFERLICHHPDVDRLEHWLQALGAGDLLRDGVIELSSSQRKGLSAEFSSDGKMFQV